MDGCTKKKTPSTTPFACNLFSKFSFDFGNAKVVEAFASHFPSNGVRNETEVRTIASNDRGKNATAVTALNEYVVVRIFLIVLRAVQLSVEYPCTRTSV